jgi:hypothetical protein
MADGPGSGHARGAALETVVIVPVRKFGEILVSRPAGREAALIMMTSFVPSDPSELIQLDFAGVKVVAPSWLDEVLTALRSAHGDRIECLARGNASVIESLETLAQS